MMCLAVPGKIVRIDRTLSPRMATVDFGGVCRDICVEWVDVEENDYILAHAGIALTRMDAREAEETLHDFELLASHAREEVADVY